MRLNGFKIGSKWVRPKNKNVSSNCCFLWAAHFLRFHYVFFFLIRCDFTMLRCYNYVDLQKGQLGCTLETHDSLFSFFCFPLCTQCFRIK